MKINKEGLRSYRGEHNAVKYINQMKEKGTGMLLKSTNTYTAKNAKKDNNF